MMRLIILNIDIFNEVVKTFHNCFSTMGKKA